jgi:formate dehydrogenase maturation protein FdhE
VEEEVGRPWPERRRRVRELQARYPFLEDQLRLYAALLEVWEETCSDPPPGPEALAHARARVLPGVVEATVRAAPERLARAAEERFRQADPDQLLGRWLAGAEQADVDRYLARASLDPLLEVLDPGSAAALCSGPRDERHCPSCGGPPQLSWYPAGGASLETGPRRLRCARCGRSWAFARLACAVCGEREGSRLPVFGEARAGEGELVVRGLAAEDPSLVLPHLRVEACDACHSFLVGVDLGREARAVPVVDELAALPLVLHASERGYRKAVPNLMGL